MLSSASRFSKACCFVRGLLLNSFSLLCKMSENCRSAGYYCVVFGCSNNFSKRKRSRAKWCDEHKKPQCECGCNMFVLQAFPTDSELRRQWIANVNREGFVPNSSSRVCSDHFVDGKRTVSNPVPMLRLGYHRKVCHHFTAWAICLSTS